MTLVLNGTTGVSAIDGSASTPAIQGNDSNTGMFFPAADTIAFAEGGTEVMRIDSAGNVGIGTSAPTQKLEVVGAADFTTNAGNGNGVRIRTPSGSGSAAVIQFTNNPVTAQWGFISSPASGVLAFGGGTEYARFDNAGKALFGTTSGFDATTGATLMAYGTSSSSAFKTAGTTNTIMSFYNDSGSARVGWIGSSGTSTSFNTTSDYRLKEDVKPMVNALARVAAMRPVTYKWKFDGAAVDGFIAHELAEVCPQAVTGEKDAVDAEGNPVYQGIDTSFLVATLTAAIQEQQALIESLTARIAALEAA